jgi:CRISPR-associated protein Csb2
MIPLRRAQGQRLHIVYSVPITEAVRNALTKYLPDGAPGMLTGHNADGTVLTRQHMAIIPLPRVGDTYADGDVLGVGLLLPTDCSDADYGLLIEGLGRWLRAGGHVDIGGIRWVMEVANGDPRRGLRADRFDGMAATWTSVTPVVCDRHPRRDLTLLDVVGTMCRDVGLPMPESVEAASYGQLIGADDSRRHSLGGRDYLGRQYTRHLRIVWPRKVPGPILLGRGRYFGLGVMLPSEEAA